LNTYSHIVLKQRLELKTVNVCHSIWKRFLYRTWRRI